MQIKPAWIFWTPLVLALVIIYYPLLWGMVPSANDIYGNYDPWREGSFERHASNPTLNDIPMGYWTKAAMLRREPGALLWNPYLAAGMPGSLDLLSASFNLFFLIPTLVSLKGWYALMLLLKVLAAYGGMYLLARAWGLSPAAGAAAGLAWALFGQNLVFLFWPQTNASVLFPWLFLLPSVQTRRWFFALAALLALSFLGSGFPAYAFYAAYAFAAYLVAVEGRKALPFLRRSAAPFLLALLAAAPLLWVTAGDLRDAGSLGGRAGYAAREAPVPPGHLGLFLSPRWAGTPQHFPGIPGFPAPNNYHAASVYLGIASLGLAALGALGWRDRRNRFFILFAALLFFLLYLSSPLRTGAAALPGIASSPFHRLFILLGFALACLAAFGADRLERLLRRPWMAAAVPLALALDLGFAAAAFLPYQKWGEILPERTPALAFLEERLRDTPYRVAGMYDALLPNSAEWTALPDIRSHALAEGWYREALAGAEPAVGSRTDNFITFWDARTVHHPLLTGLFVRYIAEPPFIKTVENEIEARTVRESASLWTPIPPEGFRRKLHPPGTPYRLGLALRGTGPVDAVVREEFSGVALRRLRLEPAPGGGSAWAEVETPWDLAFVPLELEVLPPPGGVEIGLRATGEMAVAVGMSPLRPVYGGPDLTLFENREADTGALLRFHATDRFPPNYERLRTEGVVDPPDLPRVREWLGSDAVDRRGTVRFEDLDRRAALATVEVNAPALLVLPFKFNPRWARLRVNGAPAEPLRVNGAMTGVLVERGMHRVEIGYGTRFLPWAAGGLLVLFLTAAWAVFRWRRPVEPSAG